MSAILQMSSARLVQALLVVLVIGLASFAMMQALPGDSAYRIAAGRYGYDVMDAQVAEAVRLELGLDQPVLQQMGRWLTQLATLDLGRSLVSGQPVWQEISGQLGASLLLACSAIVMSLLIAIPVGVLSGLNPGGKMDRLSMALSVSVRSIPAFALAVVLMLLLAVQFKLLPVAGYGEIRHLVLPSLALALSLAAVSNRVLRDIVVEAVASPWFQFSRTKGLSQAATVRRHVARNVAAPLVAYVGVQLALLIEGVVIIESVFSWPGIGHALVHAIFERDVPMVQGAALTLGLLFVALNFGVDLLCKLIDPRDRVAAS
ncbi:ABC transporter permease [Granulosicoccus antarcticus]|uniref:Glutathione transport system permease protein GsiC n=1 Tax=Granulosicoccus antarcticus IMCC3135 TaxID=1192854 RepID=A0A2Z2P4Y1_9GAMM|nr:ABC transporter permease [Granulosicoccus antarcticus]ASJ75737.1 Glutathione transport system permease protein GsiC [Granulosicoccus antarcticus IMCC3135]